MGFSDPLDTNAPLGSDQIGAGDDSIRTLERALQERLATLVADLNVNPLVLVPGAIPDAAITEPKLAPGAVTGPKLEADANIRSIIVSKQQYTHVGTIASQTAVSQDKLVPGCEVGDIVLVEYVGAAPIFVYLRGWIPVNGTVRITVTNDWSSAASFDYLLAIIVIKASPLGT